MTAKVTHFEIIGKDGKKLQDFYSQLFEWKVDANNPMSYGMVDAAQSHIGGGIASDMQGRSRCGNDEHREFPIEGRFVANLLDAVTRLGLLSFDPPRRETRDAGRCDPAGGRGYGGSVTRLSGSSLTGGRWKPITSEPQPSRVPSTISS